MKTIGIAVLIVITTLITCGCGTIVNLRSGAPEVYGGVQKDVEWIMTPPAGGADTASGGGNPGVLLIIAGEVGLSLIGDTLTLPVVIRKQRMDNGKAKEINPAGCKKGR